MARDIEYWQNDAETITVEPKNFAAKSAMVDEFPIYGKAKHYKAYLSNIGSVCWVFPVNSDALKTFLENTNFKLTEVKKQTELVAS